MGAANCGLMNRRTAWFLDPGCRTLIHRGLCIEESSMTRFKSIPIDQLFWSLLHPTLDTNTCWEWPKGRTNQGYGLFQITMPDGRKESRAHRVAYLFAYGAIPQGYEVCHTCNHKPCCRPSHLYAGTHAQNMQDAARDGLILYGARRHDKNGRWSTMTDACRTCQTTERPHMRNGQCSPCYYRWYYHTHRASRRKKILITH